MRMQRTGILKDVAITLLLGVILFGLGSLRSNAAQKPRRSASARRQAVIPELNTIDQLKEAFERDAGKVRLVALLSPT